jgi:cation diffusion facilitator CzcD-associated flavoprotein CzcO
MDQHYQYAVVGAGPAGIMAIGKLLDAGVSGEAIIWVDPLFSVGDLGAKWRNVSSNTIVKTFIDALKATRAFEFDALLAECSLNSQALQETCELSHVVDAMQCVSDHLMHQVAIRRTFVTALNAIDSGWDIACGSDNYHVARVILAVGSVPNTLDTTIKTLPIDVALNPGLLQKTVAKDAKIAVFGSSHSAVLVIKNLVENGCRVINFVRSPTRYAIYHEGWIEYDNTGLKGIAAKWAKTHLETPLDSHIQRYESTPENTEHFLEQCDAAVYAIGFSPRTIAVNGAIDFAAYNNKTGEIAPGLYGCGIAFPEAVVDRAGNHEMNVGIWKFNGYLDRVLPAWL